MKRSTMRICLTVLAALSPAIVYAALEVIGPVAMFMIFFGTLFGGLVWFYPGWEE